MDSPLHPIVLLADSQLLFWRRDNGELFLRRLRRGIDAERPRAAYLGASNGDQPEFFELFRGAMEGIGLTECRHIPSEPSAADFDFLAEANLILLAGGDVALGWRAFREHELLSPILERYYAGAVLIGLSAGAVQLGLFGASEPEDASEAAPPRLFETFKLVPMLVDVHDEPDWSRLQRQLRHADDEVAGLGIPSGGGALLHPDLSLEAVRRPLVEWRRTDEGLRQSLLLPPGSDDEGSEGS